MKLDDLPALIVDEITLASDEFRVRARFTHLRGVQLGSSFLYCGDAQWPGDLIECDADTRNAVFSAPSWVQRDLVRVGSIVPWLPAIWQFHHVNMILAGGWELRAFTPSDAQHFRVGSVHGWTKVGSTLSSNEVPTHIEKGGWDHEECQICDAKVGRGGQSNGYVNLDDKWLCQTCHERYGQTRDLGFVLGL